MWSSFEAHFHGYLQVKWFSSNLRWIGRGRKGQTDVVPCFQAKPLLLVPLIFCFCLLPCQWQTCSEQFSTSSYTCMCQEGEDEDDKEEEEMTPGVWTSWVLLLKTKEGLSPGPPRPVLDSFDEKIRPMKSSAQVLRTSDGSGLHVLQNPRGSGTEATWLSWNHSSVVWFGGHLAYFNENSVCWC